jgi:membrane-associated protease RseP (regulator of RpoE activity)
MSLGVILFIVAILIVVMIHEGGHLIAAKLFGFKATKFFVGFGPPLWSFKKGETEYGIAAIPAGGFVKIVGMNPYEEVPEEDQPRSYPNKPAWQRAIVLVAGSATHWVVAFVILVVTTMTIGFPTNQGTNEVALVEQEVQGETAPAAAAGLKAGDVIVAINGEETQDWNDTRAAIRATAPGETLDLTVLRGEEELDLTARLGEATFSSEGELLDYRSGSSRRFLERLDGRGRGGGLPRGATRARVRDQGHRWRDRRFREARRRDHGSLRQRDRPGLHDGLRR